jgi:hypothetical protein
MQKAVQPLLFAALLLLAAYLRITGLTWAINSGYGHELNFQPDEFLSLRGVREIDLLHGRLRAPSAYWEGTVNYYLWAIPKAAIEVISKEPPFSTGSTNASDIGDLLYICRWMTVLPDLAAVIILLLQSEKRPEFLCFAVWSPCLRRPAHRGHLCALYEATCSE